MKYLGIDYGKRKMGLSISEGELADPLKVLEINSLEDAVQKIHLLIKAEAIEKVVIGLPESGEARSITEKLIKRLRELEIKVMEVDETLSSQNALGRMIEMGVSKKSRGKEDAYAAQIILQNYLDSLK